MKVNIKNVARWLMLLMAMAGSRTWAQKTIPTPVVVNDGFGRRSFFSAALGREMPYSVILPAGYTSGQRRYPTLYLLHGWQGDETNWIKLTHLVQDAAAYALIIVMPRAENSWYVNSATKPLGRYEDYISQDLIADVDEHYRTIAATHERAIAGLSMGGYGALLLTLKHPGEFGFAASISGAFAGPSGIEDILPQLRPSTEQAYGPAGSATRKKNDVDALLSVADGATVPYLFLECGTSDPLLSSNRRVASELSSIKVAYEYHELPGAHTWSFWDNSLPVLLQVLAEHLNVPATSLALPRSSRYDVGARRKDSYVPAISTRP